MKEQDVVFISGLPIPDVDKLCRLVGFTTYYKQGVWYMHKFNEHKLQKVITRPLKSV